MTYLFCHVEPNFLCCEKYFLINEVKGLAFIGGKNMPWLNSDMNDNGSPLQVNTGVTGIKNRE